MCNFTFQFLNNDINGCLHAVYLPVDCSNLSNCFEKGLLFESNFIG